MTDALLNAYLAIEALSAQMLHAAERADWPAFTQVHRSCTRQIDSLRQRTQNPADFSPPVLAHLSTTQAAQKQAILLRILRNDAQIRRLRAGAVADAAYPFAQQAPSGLLH